MSEIKSYIGESATDLSIRAFGSIEGLLRFCIDNGISLDHEESLVGNRVVDDARKQELLNNIPLFPVKVSAKQQSVKVSPGQNIIDVALQETGSVEGLISILKLNGYPPNISLIAGTELKVESAGIVSNEIRNFYRSIGYIVNTNESSVSVAIGYLLREKNKGFLLLESSDLIELE
jgi:hypothetical protein